MSTAQVRRSNSNKKYTRSVANQEARIETWLSSHPLARRMVSVPIRDTHRVGAPVAFFLDFYGMSFTQLSLIQFGEGEPADSIGSAPIIRALRRRGFDPDRYQAFLWDLIDTDEEKNP